MLSFSRSNSRRVEKIEQFFDVVTNAQRMLMRRPTVQGSSCLVSRGVGAQIDHHLDLVTAIVA
jgi:hypothetical protein